jgi:hypothetical protein
MSTPKLKTINIKGKEYVTVAERLRFIASDEFPHDYTIETKYRYYPERKMWVVKAVFTIFVKGEGNLPNYQSFTGHAQEVESDNYKDVNYTSALENAETSAIGRALAVAGIGVIGSIASADEVVKAQNRGSAVNTSNGTAAFESEKPATSTEDLPWLKDKQLEAVIARIKAGDKSIYQKTLAAFKVNKDMRAKLSEAVSG